MRDRIRGSALQSRHGSRRCGRLLPLLLKQHAPAAALGCLARSHNCNLARAAAAHA
jgi:hypothetical protein